ncbi:MAG: tRNA (adenosine(37)-N6)-dimethylallyltransferase MiaA [Alphaproteobacteria bacterium]
MQKNIIIIAGPTASGKSQLAIDLAEKFNGEIINCDSQQLYKDTPIISACPSGEDKTIMPHHLYQIYESTKHGNVVDWLNLCVEKIKTLWNENKTPVIVGGTGLYINNLVYGTTPIPSIDTEVRNKVEKENNPYNLLDEKAKNVLNPNDTTRTKRALEVLWQTGRSIVDWHDEPLIKAIEANFFIIKIIPSKKELDERIDFRFNKMVELGAIDEAKNYKSLNINPMLPASKALGLPEIIDYLDGTTTLDEAIELAKIHTHQYAKRQITWFKNKLEANFIFDKCYKEINEDLINFINKSF